MTNQEVRTRFPPSPTGHLHVGGARTALFNWLFARHFSGKFIFRVEDTDATRSTQEAVDVIRESMRWLGLDWDEGPYFQSKRLDTYRRHVEKLLDQGQAYRCFCKPEDLENKRKHALKERKKPKYDGTCRELRPPYPHGPHAVRFRCPDQGQTVFDDLIKGGIAFDNSELDDLVILRSDGMPTYNLAVVVDDVTMGITHVIRGDDHVNNTPRQILLFRAFSYPLPQFAHVPMILGPDKTRLSKRHDAQSVLAYKEMGYLPQGLVNYLVRLGWSYGDQEFFTVDELIAKFTLENVGKSASMFDPEKLRSINGDHIKASSSEDVARLLLPFVRAKGYAVSEGERLTRIAESLKERAKTLTEMADQAEFYFFESVEYDEKSARKFLVPQILPVLERITQRIRSMDTLDQERLETMFREIADQLCVKLVGVAQPVRVSLTGRSASPGLFDVMDILGKEAVLKRLEDSITFIRVSSNAERGADL